MGGKRVVHKGYMFDEFTPDTDCHSALESDDISTNWDNVTCKNCLSRRKKERVK